MGVREVPECDIFKTLQPKGLQEVYVIIAPRSSGEEPIIEDTLFYKALSVGERGKQRVLRMVQAACQPPKTREAKADVSNP